MKSSLRILKVTGLVLIVGAACLVGGCDTFESKDDIEFEYTAYDVNGASIVTGTFSLKFSEPENKGETAKITGAWSFEYIRDSGQTGPQSRNGKLIGAIRKDGSYWINLDPDLVDANVVLYGADLGDRKSDFEGTWNFVGVMGIVDSGPFNAVRK